MEGIIVAESMRYITVSTFVRSKGRITSRIKAFTRLHLICTSLAIYYKGRESAALLALAMSLASGRAAAVGVAGRRGEGQDNREVAIRVAGADKLGRSPAVGNATGQCRRSLGGEQAEDQRGDGEAHDGGFG